MAPNRDYGISFHEPEDSLPDHPGHRTAEPSHSASFVDFEALLLLRVRSQPLQISPQRLADTLLAFGPSRARPPTPRVLNPPGPHGPRTTYPPAAGQTATPGTLQPLDPGGTSPLAETNDSTHSAVPGPLRDRTAPPLGGAPTSLTSRSEPKLLTLAFEASKYVDS